MHAFQWNSSRDEKIAVNGVYGDADAPFPQYTLRYTHQIVTEKIPNFTMFLHLKFSTKPFQMSHRLKSIAEKKRTTHCVNHEQHKTTKSKANSARTKKIKITKTNLNALSF